MKDEDALGIIDELCKEARSTFTVVTVISIFTGIVLLNILDRELFVLSRQIELPIVGAQMSIDKFFWIVPAVIALLCAYLNLLIRRVVDISKDIGRESELQVYAKSPTFLRWAIDEALDGRISSRADYYASLLVLYGLSISTLVFIWWRSHIFHNQVLSFVTVVGLGAIVLSHWIVVRGMPGNARYSTRWRNAAILAVLALVVVSGVSYWRTEKSDGRLYAKADLSLAEIAPRPDGYVPRFVWASAFIRGSIRPGEDLAALTAPRRKEIEGEWYERRMNYLKEFGRSDLDGVDLGRANLSGAFLVGVRIRNGSFDGAQMFGADMEALDATGSTFVNANLEGAHVEQAYLKDADFSRANMDRASLQESNLTCTKFSGADLSEAKFDGAFIDRADFSNANLRGASFRGAYAKRAGFKGADLSGADFRNAILWGADLSDVKGLKQDQLDAALGDDETILPAGYSAPKCWPEVPSQNLPYRQQWWLDVGQVKERLLCPRDTSIALSPSATCQD